MDSADHPEADRLRFDFARYPYLTAEVPAVTGVIRQEHRDFQVEEVPAEPPRGEGEHLLVWVEKEDQTTRRVVEHWRDALGLPEEAIGWAGLKDRRALTRQWLSVPYEAADRLFALPQLEGVRLLDRARHDRKLQEGYLAGNRFRILLREVQGDPAAARRTLETLAARGVPNYFGPQRFGRFGDNAERGLGLIRKGRGRSKRWLDKLLINALQSFLFNEWLAERMGRGLFDRVIHGDVAEKHATGGKFLVGDPEAEAPRAAAFEISATGPLFGRKYHEAQFEARALEDEVLVRFGLSRADFAGSPGSRRAGRIPLADWAIEACPEGLWLSFYLPRGAYATSVLRELMKTNPEATAGEESL